MEDAAARVRAWRPDETVLLPLYPLFSTTTTTSSLTAWRNAVPDIPVRVVCCYPQAGDFIASEGTTIGLDRAAGT